MFDKFDLLAISAKQRAERYLERLVQEEKGASDIVAILVVIVILLAIAGIFKKGLAEVVDTVFSKVTDWINQQQ